MRKLVLGLSWLLSRQTSLLLTTDASVSQTAPQRFIVPHDFISMLHVFSRFKITILRFLRKACTTSIDQWQPSNTESARDTIIQPRFKPPVSHCCRPPPVPSPPPPDPPKHQIRLLVATLPNPTRAMLSRPEAEHALVGWTTAASPDEATQATATIAAINDPCRHDDASDGGSYV